jgi:CRP/FNR family transcriptional regulator
MSTGALTPFQQRVQSILARTPLFTLLEPDDVTAIVALMERRSVTRRTFLFHKGEPGDRLYGVVVGCLKVCSDSQDGRQVTFSVLGVGDIVGELAVTGSRPRSASVVAMTDCELASLERHRLESILARRPAVLGALTEACAVALCRLTARAEDTAFLSLDARLAKTLQDLMLRIGQPSGAGVHVPFRQQDLADMLCVSRESVNKRLREWEERGWLGLRRGTIVVYAPGPLDALASETS